MSDLGYVFLVPLELNIDRLLHKAVLMALIEIRSERNSRSLVQEVVQMVQCAEEEFYEHHSGSIERHAQECVAAILPDFVHKYQQKRQQCIATQPCRHELDLGFIIDGLAPLLAESFGAPADVVNVAERVYQQRVRVNSLVVDVCQAAFEDVFDDPWIDDDNYGLAAKNYCNGGNRDLLEVVFGLLVRFVVAKYVVPDDIVADHDEQQELIYSEHEADNVIGLGVGQILLSVRL